MTDCIFCKIIRGEVPAHRVYEDDRVLAFLDSSPVNPGHTLLVPKAHSADLLDTSAATLQALVLVLPRVARAVQRAVGAGGFNVGVNNGSAAGQVVAHVHCHIIPRFVDDGYRPWGHRTYREGEAAEIAEKIHAAAEQP